MHKYLMLIILWVFSFSCHSLPKDVGGDEKLILKQSNIWNLAFMKKDSNVFLSMFSDDIQLATAGGKCASLEGIKNFFEKLNRLRPNVEWKNTSHDININQQWNVAYEIGEWKESWTEPDGKTVLTGKYFALWKKMDNIWKVNAIIFTPMNCVGSEKYCIKK